MPQQVLALCAEALESGCAEVVGAFHRYSNEGHLRERGRKNIKLRRKY